MPRSTRSQLLAAVALAAAAPAVCEAKRSAAAGSALRSVARRTRTAASRAPSAVAQQHRHRHAFARLPATIASHSSANSGALVRPVLIVLPLALAAAGDDGGNSAHCSWYNPWSKKKAADDTEASDAAEAAATIEANATVEWYRVVWGCLFCREWGMWCLLGISRRQVIISWDGEDFLPRGSRHVGPHPEAQTLPLEG